jgi:hypothetical protein
MPEQPECFLYAGFVFKKATAIVRRHLLAGKLKLLLGWRHSLTDDQEPGARSFFLCFEG